MINLIKGFGKIYSAQVGCTTVLNNSIYYAPDGANSVIAPNAFLKPKLVIRSYKK